MDMAKPIIRFKGYQDDWEQRKLPEFVSFFNGLTYTPDDVEETGTLVLRSSNVKNGEIVDADNVYVNDKVVTSENVHEGDIIVVVRNGSRALIGKHAQIKDSMPNTVIGAFMSGMRSEHSSFVNALLDTSAFENEIAKNMGATINQITGYMFSKMEFMIPSGNEQQKIGEYFQSLDNLITLHQRKCDETKKLKKYMLQKMFPQNGEKVPEIRFSGFTDDWEQRKLGDDLVSIHTGTNLLGSTTNTGMPLIKMGNIQRGYFDTSKLEFLAENEQPDNEDIANYGDFFFNTRNTLELVGKGATWMKNSGEYAFNSNIARFELRNIDTIFFNYLYNTETMTRQIHARAMGTTSVAAIYPRTLESVGYLVPCMKEQQKIGAYFKHLDNLITLHQRELENLQNIKRFMLGKMFV